MKKIISLALVLCLIFALAPAALAADSNAGAADPKNDGNKLPKIPSDVVIRDLNDFLVYYTNYFFFDEAGDGIFQKSGHLISCTGNPCQCLAVMVAAEKEQRQIDFENSLQVWIRSSRDDEDQRHDTVVAELERPYKAKKVTENEEYLEGKSAVAEKLKELVDEDELAEQLYRPSEFIHNQVIGSLDYIVADRGSKLHVEYLVTSDGVNPLYGYGIGLAEEGSELGTAEHFIVSRDPIAESTPEHELLVHAGNVIVSLPEGCVDKAWTMALSFYENGALGLLLIDDEGKLIPGAAVSTVLPEGAAKAVTVDADGKFADIKDSAVEGSLVAFTAPTGEDVFALSK